MNVKSLSDLILAANRQMSISTKPEEILFDVINKDKNYVYS